MALSEDVNLVSPVSLMDSAKETDFSFIYRVVAFFKLIRVKHWVKNSFIFIPAFFAGQFFHPELVIKLLLGFLAFSLIASSIYIINDYKDIAADKAHPKKQHRPLASGAISLPFAFFSLVVLISAGVFVAFQLGLPFLAVALLYLVINIGYSYGLKRVALLDIFILAFGFLLRVLAGGFVAEVVVSEWLVIMIFLLALFLGIAKRRDDVVLFVESGKQLRHSTRNYNLEFLNACLAMVSTVIMVAYVMYTISDAVKARLGSDYIYVTAVFVVAGIMRYLQIAMVEKKSGSPTDILYQDPFIRYTILAWAFTFFILLYGPALWA